MKFRRMRPGSSPSDDFHDFVISIPSTRRGELRVKLQPRALLPNTLPS